MMAESATIGDLVFYLKGEDSGLSKALDSASQRVAAMGKTMQAAGQGIRNVGLVMGAAGAAISGALGYSVKVAGDFEQAITNAASVTGKTGAEFEAAKKKMSDLAETLGMTTVFSAREAADAMYDLSSKGFDVAAMSVEELVPILDLAAATQDNLTHTTETVTGVLRAYGMENNETARIADVFTKVIGSSAATMDKLNASMSFVAPVATAAGVSFEDLTANLGMLYNANLDGSTAGTALRRTIAELMAPGEKLTGIVARLGGATEADAESLGKLGKANEGVQKKIDALQRRMELAQATTVKGTDAKKKHALQMEFMREDMKKLTAEQEVNVKSMDGIIKKNKNAKFSMADLDLKTHSLTEVMATLKKNGFTAADAMAAFGQRAGPASIILGGLGKEGNAATDATAELTEKLKNAGGTAAEVAANQLKTLNGQMKLMKSAFEAVVLQVGGALIPRMTELAKMLGKVFQNIAAWMKKNKDLTATIIKIVAGVGLFLTVGGAFLAFFGTALIAIGGFIAAIGAIGSAIAVTGLPVILALGAAVMAIGIPLLALGAIIAAGISGWIEKMGGIEKAMAYVVEQGKVYFAIAKEYVMAFWNWLVPVALETWERMKAIGLTVIEFSIAFGTKVMEVAQTTIIPAVMSLWQTIQDVWGVAKVFIDSTVGFVIEVFDRVWGIVSEWIENNRAALTEAAMNIWNLVSAVWTRIVGVLIEGITAVWTYWLEIKPLVVDTIAIIVDMIGVALSWALEKWNTFWPIIENVVMASLEVVIGIIKFAWNAVSGIVKTALQIFTGDWEGAWETIKATIVNAGTIIWDTIKNLFSALFDGVGSFFEGVWTRITGFWDGVLEYIKSIPGKIGGFLSDLPGIIAYPFKAAWAMIISGVNFMIDAINSVSIDIPEWLNNLPGIDFGGKTFGFDIANIKPPEFAKGGRMPHSGMALVGERGPELVQLPGGSQVTNAKDSAAMLGPSFNFRIDKMQVRDDTDIQRIADALYQRTEDAMRRRGIPAMGF